MPSMGSIRDRKDSYLFTESSKLVIFDAVESVGGPRGTLRSSGDLAVQTKTPKESRSPDHN